MLRNNPLVPLFSLPEKKNTFLKTDEKIVTFGDLYRFAANLNSIKRDADWKDDDLLLILARPSDELVMLIAAAFLVNIPVMPIHHEVTDHELDVVLRTVKPVAVYSSQERNSERFNELPRIDLNQPVQSDLLSESELRFDMAEAYAGCFLTSGTAGKPKIVPIKRRQVFFQAEASANNFRPAPNKFWLLCLPLNHVGGINVIYRSLLYGSAIYLAPNYETDTIGNLLHESKEFEAASMVPTMLEKLLEKTFFRVQFNFKGLLLGGGPISLNLINRALTRGIPIVTSYGMTETCAQIAANPMLRPSGMYIPKQSIGSIFPPNEIEIRDESGRVLPLNEPGQIWLRGPQIFDGYLDDEENSRKFDEDGWFNTGDFGHLNRKKQLFIESRRTDLIITGGENVNPGEVEEALKSIEDVNDAAVIGVPDKLWGQKVVAFYTADTESLAAEHLKDELAGELQSFKIPKEFIRLDEIPKTELQKIKRAELAEDYRKGLFRQ